MSARADIMAFIDANSRGFHDAMKRVRSDAKNTAQSAQRDFSKLSDGMVRSMNYLKAAMAGLGVGLSLQGAKEIISDVASIEREAKRAGVSIKEFQQLKYVAESNHVDMNSMIDAMKKLKNHADEFAAGGKGTNANIFMQLGISASQMQEKLKKPADLFAEILDKVGQLTKASQVKVMDNLFGGGAGERFVDLIAMGEDGIRKAKEEATRLGYVIEDDLVKRAAELDEAFNSVVSTVSQSLKLAIVSAATELKFFLDLLNKTEDRSLSTLERQLEEKKRSRTIMSEDSYRGFILRGRDNGRIAVIDEEIAGLEKQIGLIKERNNLDKSNGEIKLKEIIIDDKPKGRSGSSRKEAISEAEKQKKAADELIQSLEHEYQMLGKTASEQRIATELRKLSIGATDEQKTRIEHLITAIDAQSKAQELANKRQQQFIDGVNQLESDTVDALGQVIAGTENAADAFKKLAIEIVKSAITGKGAYADFFQSMFGSSGGGGLGNVLGGLLGFGGQKSIAMAGGIGLYAKGGISDRPAIFGEAGPEAAVPLPDGRSIPVDLRMSALPSLQPAHHENNQSATVFNFAPVINAPNADAKGLEQVEKRLDKMQREMPATVIETMRKAQNANVKF